MAKETKPAPLLNTEAIDNAVLALMWLGVHD